MKYGLRAILWAHKVIKGKVEYLDVPEDRLPYVNLYLTDHGHAIPNEEPTEPTTEPTEPTTEPTEPTEPTTEPTEPTTEPTEPTEPITEPTEPTEPTEGTNGGE